MADIPKKTALGKLEEAIDPIVELHKAGQKSPKFEKWHRETETAIRHIFGERSRNADDFAGVSYSAGKLPEKYPSGMFYAVSVRSGLEKAKLLLESMIEEVKEYWQEDEQKTLGNVAASSVIQVEDRDFRLLHPTIIQHIKPAFVSGRYDHAVFQAFKEVEIAVRKAGDFANTDLGTDLMRKAFHNKTGPFTEASLPDAEKDALAHLFAGAIGWFKNPHSHRSVLITSAATAFESIAFASYLLNLADLRTQQF